VDVGGIALAAIRLRGAPPPTSGQSLRGGAHGLWFWHPRTHFIAHKNGVESAVINQKKGIEMARLKTMAFWGLSMVVVTVSGCASVPMASSEQDAIRKTFQAPSDGMAGLYIFRDSSYGAALKKSVYIDGKPIGETAPNTFFYRVVPPGPHTLSTESEFSENDLKVDTQADTNYFIDQNIRMGVFVGGASLKVVSEEAGKKAVQKCKLAN
jgi:hypothetical protein